jgi:hypothetical protein
MSLLEKKQKLVSDFKLKIKSETSLLEKLKVEKADKKEFKQLESSLEQELLNLKQNLANEFKKESSKVTDSIRRNEDYLKSNLDSLKISKIDGGDLDIFY